MRLLSTLFFIVLFSPVSFSQLKAPTWVSKVGAKPFQFKKVVYAVDKYGAVNDGKTLNTKAIQKAIDDCAGKGGGTVSFQPGKYLTGSLFIRKNVNFEIAEGVEILGSEDILDYPEIDTRIAGIEMKWPAALLNILDQEHAAISGAGLVNAQGKVFWDLYWGMRKEYEPKGLRWIVDYDAKRPRTVLIANSKNIILKDIHLQQAGFWTVQVLYSSYVTVDHITISNNIGGHGPSTDGVDIDSSSWILVQNCDVDCNDDNFCLKSGRDWDGLRVNRPTEYVVVRNSIARSGAGMLTLGSETSGGIRHVWASGLKGYGTSNALNIKSATTRGGTVSDIYFTDVVVQGAGNVIQVNPNWNPSYSYSKLPAGYHPDSIPSHWKKLLQRLEPESKGIPRINNIHIYNINATGAKQAINAIGFKGTILERFVFKNVKIKSEKAGTIDFASSWTFENVQIEAADGGRIKLSNSLNVNP